MMVCAGTVLRAWRVLCHGVAVQCARGGGESFELLNLDQLDQLLDHRSDLIAQEGATSKDTNAPEDVSYQQKF